MNLLNLLDKRARRGSKPRCHWLTHGERSDVAYRLTELANPWAKVSEKDYWMPAGFCQLEEACLDKADRLVPVQVRNTLRDWWLVVSPRATTPTFDIASTCIIEGQMGLLLVEAKAHAEELNKEAAGKELRSSASQNSYRNHHRIGECIADASASLTKYTGLNWELSRDCCYQMSNRFAWSWKLTTLGFPVILVYLGFLNANEMRDRGSPFVNHAGWEILVKKHSRPIVPGCAWNNRLNVSGCPLLPCIRSIEMSYDTPLDGECLNG